MSIKQIASLGLGAVLALLGLALIVPVAVLFISDAGANPAPDVLTSMVQQSALGLFALVAGSWFVKSGLRAKSGT